MTNAAKHNSSGTSGADGPPREIHTLNFKTPDEASMQFLEEQWLVFCREYGLKGDVPDLRAIVAARAARAQMHPESRWRRLVRPFVAAYHWFTDFN